MTDSFVDLLLVRLGREEEKKKVLSLPAAREISFPRESEAT